MKKTNAGLEWRLNSLRAIALGVVLVLAAPVLWAQQAQPRGETLSLRQAVTMAVENSRELTLARIRADVSDRAADYAGSVFRPNLYTGSGAAYTTGFPTTTSGPPTLFNLSYVQTVFNGPLRGQYRASRERAKASNLGVQRVRESVILNAASAYLELAKVRHSLSLLRTELESARRIVDISRQRSSEGLELPIELTRAQLSAARVEQRLIQFEGQEERLAYQLRNMTGLPADRSFEVSSEEFPSGMVPPVQVLIDQAVSNSPELKEAEIERRAREHRLKGERHGYWPTMDLVSYYAVYSENNDFGKFYNAFERQSFSFGLRMQIPIFGSRTSTAVALARSELTAAEIELKNKRADLELAIRGDVQQAREVEATREVARLELQLAQENLRLLQAQFQEGRLNLRDLEKARVEESEKWMQFVDAQYQRQKAQLHLMHRTGQLSQMFP